MFQNEMWNLSLNIQIGVLIISYWCDNGLVGPSQSRKWLLGSTKSNCFSIER